MSFQSTNTRYLHSKSTVLIAVSNCLRFTFSVTFSAHHTRLCLVVFYAKDAPRWICQTCNSCAEFLLVTLVCIAVQGKSRSPRIQTVPDARHRNPPPRFSSEQKKSEAASESGSSDEEQANSSDEEDEGQRVEVYQVLFEVTYRHSAELGILAVLVDVRALHQDMAHC